MFDQMFGDMQKKQEEMKKTLSQILVKKDIEDGALEVEVNANKEILNISINPNKIDMNNREQLEDLLVVVLNEALEEAEKEQAQASQSLLSDLLPGGMENLFGK